LDTVAQIAAEQPRGARVGQGELSWLAEFAQEFVRSNDTEETLRRAVAKIADHMDAEGAALFLIDQTSGDYVCRASFGPINIVGFRVEHGHGIVGRTIAEDRVQLVRDVQHDPDFAGRVVKGFMPRTMIAAPLSTANGPIGALQTLNKHNGALFDQHDADILRLLAVPTALALNNARLAQDLAEQNRIRREFQLARQMQKTLLPKRRKNFPVVAINVPAREISGDFFDFFDLPDGRIGFCVGDVSGKGMDAALLMVRASSLMRWLGKDYTPPVEWLSRANDELCGTTTRGMFVCAVCGYYDPNSSVVEFASAGFPPTLLRSRAGASRSYPAEGPPLGILPGMIFEAARAIVGDGCFYLFSDGATDVRGADGETIGISGVHALIESVEKFTPRARLRAMVTQLRRMRLADDTTLMLLDGTAEKRLWLTGISVFSDSDNLRVLRRACERCLRELGVDSALTQHLVLAVDEACANVIRHAYQGDANGRLELDIQLCGRVLEFSLRDFAPRVDPSCIKPRDLNECKPGGLGINLIDQVMDSWHFSVPPDGVGNLLTMCKELPL
jgi:phosphoserine phosphatase RsbU/P